MSSKMFTNLKKTDYTIEKHLNISPMNIEKPQTLKNFTSIPKFIKVYIMSQDDQLFWIVVHLHLQKNALNFNHLRPLM